ncbi:MAG: hypothetical protein ABSA47_16555 [Verrucomicrobiota bacterium]
MDTVTQTNDTTGRAIRTVAGLVVFDARTGVRLWDATLSAEGVDKLAQSLADAVLAAQRKQTAPGLPTICLMSVRNAELPRGMDGWCDSVGLMLERQLTALPDCAVLERERLDQVNKERTLPTTTEQQQLLASLVMMQMECGRSADGQGVWASLQLTDNAGKVLAGFAATNQSANGAELSAALCQKVVAALKLKPGDANEDRVQEAARFQHEANFFLSHRDSEHGIQDLEVAFALKPDDLSLQKALALTLIGYAPTQTNLVNNLRIADRGSEMYVEYARKAQSAVKPTAPRGTYSFAFQLPEWSAYMGTFTAETFNDRRLSASENTEARQLLRALYARFCAFRVELALPALAETVFAHSDDSKFEAGALFHDYEYVMVTELWENGSLAALFPEDWSRHWLATLNCYLDFLAQLSLERQSAQAHEIDWGLSQLLFWEGIWDKVRPAEREPAWHLLAAHSCPLVRALGKLSELNAEGKEHRQESQILPSAQENYRLYLQGALEDPAQNTNLFLTRLLYGAAAHVEGEQMPKFCAFMLERNDLHPDIINQMTSYLLSRTNRESASQVVAYCDRAAALLQRPYVRYFGGSDTNQYLQYLEKQRAIAENYLDGITKPQLPSLPPAWREVRQLIDLAGAKQGLTQLFRPVVQGDMAYAAGFGADETDGSHFLQLVRVSLKGGAIEPLARIAVTNIAPQVASADKNNYYLGTSQGIFVFPTSGGTGRRVDQNDGLPSDQVTALDCLDGKLYIGLGESGYLVSYDLKTRQSEVLCSARRREQLSPFDNGSPLKVILIVADETQHRIVFLTDQEGGGPGRTELFNDLQKAKELHEDVFPLICAKARAGLWSYNPADHQFKGILPRWPNANFYDLQWVGRVSETQIAFVATRGMSFFDLKTDEHTLLYGECIAIGLWSGVEETLQKDGLVVNPAFHSPPEMGNRGAFIWNASFVHNNWIWSAGNGGSIGASVGSRYGSGSVRKTFGRVSMTTGREEDLAPLREGDKRFSPEECFRLIGSDQALMGDQRGLWLVTFADDDAETPPAQP